MALADRDSLRHDHPRRRRPAFGAFGSLFAAAPVTMSLIVLNVVVFLIDQLLLRANIGYVLTFPRARLVFSPLEYWGHFSATTSLFGMQFWRLLTFQFLHADLMHLLFNMFSLYFFGPLVEGHLGSAKYLRYYLICGAGGAVTYLALFMTGVLIGAPWVPLVGASAGIFGILVCAALVAPDTTVMLMFPPIPMKLRTMAWAFIAIAVYTVLTGGRNAGGEAAHLGGAIVGYALMQGQRLLGETRLSRGRPGTWG